MNVPPTPNLQNLKLHGQKTKKKSGNRQQNQPHHSPIRPKAHPNINMNAHNLHAHSYQNNTYNNRQQSRNQDLSKSPKSINNQNNCIHHPQKKAQYYSEGNPKIKYCLQCALRAQQSDGIDPYDLPQNQKRVIAENSQQAYKKKQIQSFMTRVSTLKQNLQYMKSMSLETLEASEQKSKEHLQSIDEQFQLLIRDIEEKHKQMITLLVQAMEKQKTVQNQFLNKVNSIKDSLERYIFDINKHYQQIIEDLQIDKFEEIIQQYHAKVDYYNNMIGTSKSLNKNISRVIPREQINVYLPMQELRRVLSKTNISCYQKQNRFSPHNVEIVNTDRQKHPSKNHPTNLRHTVSNNTKKSNILGQKNLPKNSRNTHCTTITEHANVDSIHSYFCH